MPPCLTRLPATPAHLGRASQPSCASPPDSSPLHHPLTWGVTGYVGFETTHKETRVLHAPLHPGKLGKPSLFFHSSTVRSAQRAAMPTGMGGFIGVPWSREAKLHGAMGWAHPPHTPTNLHLALPSTHFLCNLSLPWCPRSTCWGQWRKMGSPVGLARCRGKMSECVDINVPLLHPCSTSPFNAIPCPPGVAQCTPCSPPRRWPPSLPKQWGRPVKRGNRGEVAFGTYGRGLPN